jgi:hypothetical protein
MKAIHPFIRLLRDSELTASGCWQYTRPSYVGGNRYGAIKAWGKMVPVHRLSARWFLGHNGNEHVLHTCDNSRCWSPFHLYLGSHEDNMHDKRERGRGRSGKQKLTIEQVQEIKQAIEQGERNMHIAERYDISRSMVSSVRHGRYWA